MIKFFKKYYLILIAAFSSLIFLVFFFHTFSTQYERDVASFSSRFLAMEERLENILRYRSDELIKSGVEDQWSNVVYPNGINLHVYRNDSLIFWNTNQLPIIRFADIHFPAQGLLHLQNGWYYAKTVEVGDYVLCGSFLIKHDYPYKNDDLINDFAPDIEVPFEAKIGLEQEVGFPVFSKANAFVFSLVPEPIQTADEFESLALLVLLLISIGFWLLWLSNLQDRLPKRIGGLIPVAVVVLRMLSLKGEWFGFLGGIDAFDPSLYGTSQWFPNFFEYLLNGAVIVYLLHDVGRRLGRLNPSKWGRFLILFAFFSSFLVWFLVLYFTKGLIENSSIPLEIDKLFSLNAYSVLALGSLGVLFYGYFHFLLRVLEGAKRQGISASWMAVSAFIAACVFFFFEISQGHALVLAGFFPFVFYEFCLYLTYRQKKSNQLVVGLFLLFLFSLVTASNLTVFNERKERSVRELYANQLATERDIATELEYANLSKKLKEDSFLKRFIESPHAISLSDFQEGLERRLFHGHWERYEMDFNLFSADHLPLIERGAETTERYDALSEIIERSGIPSEIEPNLYFVHDHAKYYSYIIRQELFGKDSTRAIFMCTLKSKKIPEEIGFPRLLISSKANVLDNLEAYSIAKYHEGDLVTRYGDFNYPSTKSVLLPEVSGNKGFFDYDGYNHFLVAKNQHDAVVLSHKNGTMVDHLTSFSYLFSFYGLLILPLIFRIHTAKGFSRTMTLALKIQSVLIAMVFLSLLAFGWGSGVFVSTQYNEFTDDVIREKLSSVEKEVVSKIGDYQTLSITENGNFLQHILVKFSGVFFTDINLYDTKGYLLASSRPKVFNVGLLSEQMNPVAFKHVHFLRQSEFVHQERIGELGYASAYKPFYNNNGKLMAYINLQHFGQQREFENQIQRFLVAIVNVFILLLAISVVLALFISNWLTEPLRILQENFARVKFGKHNEQIRYDKEDEIGSLVKDYNKKLEELEYTAQQLARTEREVAWREMAKQVAHEIKNPLTPMKLSVQQLLRVFDPNDPKSEEKLKKVANSLVEQIDALSTIANEFSNFARMPNPSEEKIELVGLVRGVKEVFDAPDEREIRIESNAEQIYLMGDKDQFVRVFNNLIKNAIQSIPTGRTPEIVLSLNRVGESVEIRVSDNGVGIERSEEAKIFVPYFTTKSTGTGLGLAMVKQIIQNHKGTIDFSSIPQKGTTFIIHLPVLSK